MIITKRFTTTVLTFFFAVTFTFGQVNNDNIIWSATRKLTVNDFDIKTKQLETTPSFGQFSVDYRVSGVDFLTKNFNKKVRNYFIKTASWIDTTTNVYQSLIYQQTLFDICEVYTRQFRKALRGNRKKLANGIKIAEELNNEYVTQFAKRRVEYDRDTKFETHETKQKEWEFQIQKELTELKEFAYDK